MEDTRIKDYLVLIGARIENAEDAVDKQECLRLGLLLREVAEEYIVKVEKALVEN
jgi:hypothetical protein